MQVETGEWINLHSPCRRLTGKVNTSEANEGEVGHHTASAVIIETTNGFSVVELTLIIVRSKGT